MKKKSAQKKTKNPQAAQGVCPQCEFSGARRGQGDKAYTSTYQIYCNAINEWVDALEEPFCRTVYCPDCLGELIIKQYKAPDKDKLKLDYVFECVKCSTMFASHFIARNFISDALEQD